MITPKPRKLSWAPLLPIQARSQDWFAVYMAQQSVESVHQFEEGVQGHLLAGGADPLLPAGPLLQECGHSSEMHGGACGPDARGPQGPRPLFREACGRRQHVV
eukprot:TRINITY_DN7948_c0_g1_i1.p1 TRINITY_DN7948_c0_g1~~TRINITY_DN7948_c0_g1_i1.p1  ORF type:complete len:103 (-),score=8.56 TRINITY_DN7948_c0_g1_i1:328-636(-)